MRLVVLLVLSLCVVRVFAADSLWGQPLQLSAVPQAGQALNVGDQFSHAAAYHITGQGILLGAPGRDAAVCAGECNRGAVYVLSATGAAVEQLIEPAELNDSALFGWDIAVVGDWAAISALGYINGGKTTGAVFLYQYSAGVWVFRQRIEPVVQEDNAKFGDVLHFVDADTLLVAAPGGWSVSGGALGRVYQFNLSAGSWAESSMFSPPANIASPEPEYIGGGYGRAIHSADDWVFIGAPDTSSEGGGVGLPGSIGQLGRVYAYKAGVLKQVLFHSEFVLGTRFGWQIGVQGGALYISAQHSKPANEGSSGDITFYQVDTAAIWQKQGSISPSTGGFGHSFGAALAFSDGVTGVFSASNPGTVCNNDCGNSVYLFNTHMGGGVRQALTEHGSLHQFYGGKVIFVDGKLLVTAHGANNYSGEAYLYQPVVDLTIKTERTARSVRPGEMYQQNIILENGNSFKSAEAVKVRVETTSDFILRSASALNCNITAHDLECDFGSIPANQKISWSFDLEARNNNIKSQNEIDISYASNDAILQKNVELKERVWLNTPPVISPVVASLTIKAGAANGTKVLSLSATDDNPGESFVYSIAEGNSAAAFAVNEQGDLIVSRSSALQEGKSYALKLVVSDGVDTSPSVTVNVDVSKAASYLGSGGSGSLSALMLFALGLLGYWRIDLGRKSQRL